VGHSFTDFHGVGFTAKDWKVQVWLHLLVCEIDRLPQPPQWLCSAREYWREQAILAINGCVDPRLDFYLTDDERVALLRQIAQHVYSDLRAFGESVPRDFLNTLCELSGQSQYREDVRTDLFLDYGRALLKLLDGK
jgi:hypothetical protein